MHVQGPGAARVAPGRAAVGSGGVGPGWEWFSEELSETMFPWLARRSVDKVLVRHVSIGKDTTNNPPKLPAVPVFGAIYILEGKQPLALTIVVVNAAPPKVVEVLELCEQELHKLSANPPYLAPSHPFSCVQVQEHQRGVLGV